MKHPLTIMLLSILLTGCVSSTPSVLSMSPATIAQNSTVTRDDFKKITTVTSIPIIFAGEAGPIAVDTYRYQLVAERKDGQRPRYFLLLFTQRGYGQSWAFWKSAADKDGHEFPFEMENQNVMDGGIVQEWMLAPLTRSYLDEVLQNGTEWRIYGQNATKDFTIAPNFIDGFLWRCDALFAGVTQK